MIAPETAAAITAHSGTVPREAATPPKMTAISPGNTKPTNAEASSAGKANTSARTSQPGSDRMRSVTLVTRPSVATAAQPGPNTRSRREDDEAAGHQRLGPGAVGQGAEDRFEHHLGAVVDPQQKAQLPQGAVVA